MKKYSKILSLVLCLCMTMMLVSGCNNTSETDQPKPPENTFIETVEVKQLGPKVEVPSFAATATKHLPA